jgi:hypothetical protein
MTSSLRTIELRSTLWRIQMRPSATVKTGLASISVKYSPIRKVVACQLVMSMPSSCTNFCRLVPLSDSRSLAWMTERKESTKTKAGLIDSTAALMRRSTRFRSPDSVSSERLMKKTDWLTLSSRKKLNCCW